MKACVRHYYTDVQKVYNLKNAVQGSYDPVTDTLTFFFPRPFIITAITSKINTGLIPDVNNSEAAGAANFFTDFSLALANANAMPTGTDDGMTAYISPEEFAEYMNNWIGKGTAPANINTLLAPAGNIDEWWANVSVFASNPLALIGFDQMNSLLNNNSYKPLYITPGVYVIYNATSGGAASYSAALSALMDNLSNDFALYTNELSCPVLYSIPDTPSMASPLPLGAFLDVNFSKFKAFMTNPATTPTNDFDNLTFPQYGVNAWFMVRTSLGLTAYRLLWRDDTGTNAPLVWGTFTMADDVAQGAHFDFATADYTVFNELVLQVQQAGVWFDVIVKDVDFSKEFGTINIESALYDPISLAPADYEYSASMQVSTMGVYNGLEFNFNRISPVIPAYFETYDDADGSAEVLQSPTVFWLSTLCTNNEPNEVGTTPANTEVTGQSGKTFGLLYDVSVSGLSITAQSRQAAIASGVVVPLFVFP